jgi:hypothetical protein
MQPGFDSRGVTRPAERLVVAGDAALTCAAGTQGACSRAVCACPGVRSLQVVLRWGLRVAPGLFGGGWGCVLACLCAPPSRAAARKRPSEALPETI